MEYARIVCEMLEHADAKHDADDMTELMRCLTFAIAHATAFVDSREAQSQLVENVCALLRLSAVDAFDAKEQFVASGAHEAPATVQ